MRSARHLARFVLLGALLFAAERRFAAPPPVALAPARVAERAAAFARENGEAPDPRMRALLERDALDEALLAREARRLGLDRDDAVVRERLVSNVAFAGSEEAAPEDRYREALALGMDASDALVRRRLAALMTARLRADAARAPIDDAALRAWFEAHRGTYQQPAAARFAQLCFAGPGAEGRARAALSSLRRAPADSAAVARIGDPCLFGAESPLRSEAELARSYGAAFARAVFAAEPGAWTGPVASSQGSELVFVRERLPARDAEFVAARDAVRDACVADREDAALRAGVERLRAAYAAEPGR